MVIPRILLIGAGAVGGFCAAVMARKQLGSIYLYDTVEDLTVGKAMDINQASPYLATDTRVIGCNTLDDVESIDVIVITAGFARKAGMTRLDLLKMNLDVMKSLGEIITAKYPDAKILVVTNPVDILTWYMKKLWPEMNVFGLGCSLDTMRFRYFIAEAVDGSVDCARGIVVGMHNETMVPLVNHATVGGVPIKRILDEMVISDIVHKTRTAGTTITQRLKNHSGYYAAAHVITQIVESMVFNRLGTFPLSVYCNGEYGYDNICLALPAVVGQDGIKRILQVELDEEENVALHHCAEVIQEAVAKID